MHDRPFEAPHLPSWVAPVEDEPEEEDDAEEEEEVVDPAAVVAAAVVVPAALVVPLDVPLTAESQCPNPL